MPSSSISTSRSRPSRPRGSPVQPMGTRARPRGALGGQTARACSSPRRDTPASAPQPPASGSLWCSRGHPFRTARMPKLVRARASIAQLMEAAHTPLIATAPFTDESGRATGADLTGPRLRAWFRAHPLPARPQDAKARRVEARARRGLIPSLARLGREHRLHSRDGDLVFASHGGRRMPYRFR